MAQEITLDPLTNRTGDVWHVFLKGDFTDMLYGYKFGGKFSPQEGCYFDPSRILLDPYAKVRVFNIFFMYSFMMINFIPYLLFLLFPYCDVNKLKFVREGV